MGQPRAVELGRSCPVTRSRVGQASQAPGLAPEHFGVSGKRRLSLFPLYMTCLIFVPQLTVLQTHSAPAQTFPAPPAQSWSRLHHHMPTGKSIAGKRAQGQLGLMAPAQQQKVGRVCLGGTQGCCGALWVLGVLLMRGSVVTWGSEHPLSKQLGLRQEGATSLICLSLHFPCAVQNHHHACVCADSHW